MSTTSISDAQAQGNRLQLDRATGILVEAPKKDLFLRGPIPLRWLGEAAQLPGKTLHVALALWWLHGMSQGRSFKLTRTALEQFQIARDTAGDALVRLEQRGLISVERKPGRRPIVFILNLASTGLFNAE